MQPAIPQNRTKSNPVKSLIPCLTLSLAVLFFNGQGAAYAEDKLPTGGEIINKYIESTGGKKAYGKIQNRVIKETMEVLQAGIKATITTYQARPNKKLERKESETIGRIEKGTDGKTAWNFSTKGGASFISGVEKTDFMRESSFDTFLGWQDRYATAVCTGIEDVDSTSCFKVVLTPEKGNPQTYFFAQDSFLILRSDTQIARMKVTTYYSDYKEVDGIMTAHTKKQMLMGQTRLITTESIVQNAAFKEYPFQVPKEIQNQEKNK